MQLVASPARTAKTWSFILMVSLVTFDAVTMLLKSFGDMHIMDANTVVVINGVLGTIATVAKFVQQNIPVSTEDKVAIINAAADAPVKPGQADVAAVVVPPARL